jgi:hypothetical protein
MIVPPGGGTAQSEHGYLETTVTEVEIGKTGWRIHASIKNVGRVPVKVDTEAGPAGAYPHQPFSLIVQVDNGSGTRYLEPQEATQFEPAMPALLKPNSTWRGTFAGNDQIPHRALLYAGFGRFSYEGAFSSDTRGFSMSSAKSTNAP